MPSTYTTGDPYLQVSSCPNGVSDTQHPSGSPAFFARTSDATASDFTLNILGCGDTNVAPWASLRRIIYRTYYIASCNNCSPSDGIPTLKVIENGGTARSIAPNVEDMHVEYGLDHFASSNDGSIDTWVRSGATPCTNDCTGTDTATHHPQGMGLDTTNTEKRWEDVMAVKLFLITRDAKLASVASRLVEVEVL